MAQCAAPRISGGVVGHGCDGLCSTEVHGVIARSRLRVFGHHVIELFRHLDLSFNVDFIESSAKDGPSAVILVAGQNVLVAEQKEGVLGQLVPRYHAKVLTKDRTYFLEKLNRFTPFALRPSVHCIGIQCRL